MLTACSGHDGNKFVGTWKKSGKHESTMVVERNGDGFIVKETSQNYFGKTETLSYPAIYKDGVLKIENGMAAVTIGYQEKTKTLLVGSEEYARVK